VSSPASLTQPRNKRRLEAAELVRNRNAEEGRSEKEAAMADCKMERRRKRRARDSHNEEEEEAAAAANSLSFVVYLYKGCYNHGD
jgi:hypothetical protein